MARGDASFLFHGSRALDDGAYLKLETTKRAPGPHLCAGFICELSLSF